MKRVGRENYPKIEMRSLIYWARFEIIKYMVIKQKMFNCSEEKSLTQI